MKNIHTLILLTMLGTLLLFGCGTNINITPPPEDGVLEFGTDTTFEVVSWNLKTFPLSEQSVETLAQIIPQMKVDVIAFQEIMSASSFYELADMIPNYDALVYSATDSYRLAYLYDTRTIQVNDAYTIFNEDDNPFPRPPYVLECVFQGKEVIVIDNHLKAYGDNYIDETDTWDEEYRRRLACQMLDQYTEENFASERVIMVGDWNDQLAEPAEYNVFLSFLDKPDAYLFADMPIAINPTYNTVSYPSMTSHIDHALISNELFAALEDPDSVCRVILVDQFMGTWQNYSTQISDHRPLGLRLDLN